MDDKTLIALLEPVTPNLIKIVDSLEKLLERLEGNDLALARLIDDNNRALTKLIDDNSRAMAEILERVVNTTDRTERMTAAILSRLESAPGTSH
ncbi:MAG TPA: hypothetical protein VGX03_17105 [Candidatus Binatia bacterium]|jgi:ABC-type transporter Mla subunit MlaD|nr:hypothetical protein [Candidatus Binatia bacterium]